MMNNILIVCMGNICRSPMAEGLFRQQLAEQNSEIQVASGGLFALVNHPPDNLAQEIMLEKKDISIGSYRAKQVTPEILLQTDLILVMELAQKRKIEFDLPRICGRVHRLGKWGDFDIPDPYRRSKQVFAQTLSLIEKGMIDWLKRLL